MKWKKNDPGITLEPQDMVLMTQCNMPISELLRQDLPNKRIPPLWSVLSYVMLKYHPRDPKALWSYYRYVQRLARHAGRWYHFLRVPKANGMVRQIYMPLSHIGEHQEFIQENILSQLPVDAHAYAYRKGVSIKDCAEPHTGKALLIHLDLKDFFGSITENMVYEALCRETGYSKSLCRLLAQICCLHHRLPQGTVTSPTLSNVVFRPCDRALAQLAQAQGMVYTRYSDDLYFSGDDRKVKPFLRQVEDILSEHGFRLNREKTKVRRRQHRQTVLGLTVNERLQATRPYRRKLLQEVYYLERFEDDCYGAAQCGYGKYMQQLQGKLAYALHMDPGNEKLARAHKTVTKMLASYCAEVGLTYY